jgi:hypothetical protein
MQCCSVRYSFHFLLVIYFIHSIIDKWPEIYKTLRHPFSEPMTCAASTYLQTTPSLNSSSDIWTMSEFLYHHQTFIKRNKDKNKERAGKFMFSKNDGQESTVVVRFYISPLIIPISKILIAPLHFQETYNVRIRYRICSVLIFLANTTLPGRILPSHGIRCGIRNADWYQPASNKC